MHRFMIKPLGVLCAAVLLLVIPIIAGQIANLFSLQGIDPDGVFAWISIHHIAQAVLFIPLFLLLKFFKKDVKYQLGLGDVRRGLKYVLIFTGIFIIYTLIGFTIIMLTDSFVSYDFRLNPTNVIGYLSFQLLLSGPSEELIFRAFAITLLSLIYPMRIIKGKVSVSNLLAAVIFGLAHVGIWLSPFRLTYSLMQVIYAFALGLVYGDCYEKTGSVLYPMMIHSISNVIAVSATMIITAWF
jgi:uncharacterized protein